MPLYHERPTSKWRSGLPGWWFGAPIIALLYTLITPKYLPDIVPTPVGAVRWLVGLLVGVAILAGLHLARWILSRSRQREH
jgi:hypothetical protein